MNRLRSFALTLAILAVGCGGSSSTPQPTPNFTYSADLTSQATNLKQLNSGTRVAGWNQLTGTTTFDGQAANVEMLGNVAYVNGNGPFFGFLTLTLPDSSMITMRMDGQAVRDEGTGNTAFTCKLDVLGGTGAYLNATGNGSFTGSRDAALGGLVHIDVQANVQR